jgi:hypothetical protein
MPSHLAGRGNTRGWACAYAYCVSQRRAREDRANNHRADRAGTHVIVGGHLPAAWCRVERRRVGVRADGHTILQVGRVRLRDDVERPRGVLMLVFMRGPDGVVGGRRRGLSSGERGLLEGSEGGVEGAAERLGEGANVLGGGSGAECGHGWN